MSARDAHYGAALAAAHHAHFGMVAEGAARTLLAALSCAGHPRGTVVDLAAGSGILSRALARAGYDVLGVDISADMLAIAHAEVPAARFVHGSLYDVPLPSDAVAVTAVGEAFNYATDPRAGLDAFEARVAAIHAALQPGGIFLFDVAGPGRSGPTHVRRGIFERDAIFLTLVEEESEGRATRRIDTFVRDATAPDDDALPRYTRHSETHTLALLNPDAVDAALARAGFHAARLTHYDDFAFLPGWHGFLADKPR